MPESHVRPRRTRHVPPERGAEADRKAQQAQEPRPYGTPLTSALSSGVVCGQALHAAHACDTTPTALSTLTHGAHGSTPFSASTVGAVADPSCEAAARQRRHPLRGIVNFMKNHSQTPSSRGKLRGYQVAKREVIGKGENLRWFSSYYTHVQVFLATLSTPFIGIMHCTAAHRAYVGRRRTTLAPL